MPEGAAAGGADETANNGGAPAESRAGGGPSGRGVVRVARLGGMTAQMVGRSAWGQVQVWRGRDAGQVRDATSRANAATMRDTLGTLKGGAQKAGQLVSTVDSLLPAGEWRAAVDSLQESGTPVAFEALEPVLARGLGDRWRTRFRGGFDEQPVASASLGQVYRATWADGREVAVKVQYPDVAAAVRADLTGLTWALRLAALVSPGMAAAPVARDLRMRVEGELDYVAEGYAQRRFAAAFDGDPDIAVPPVVLAGPTVLVTEWLGGTPLAAFAVTGSMAARDEAGVRFQRFALSAPARSGCCTRTRTRAISGCLTTADWGCWTSVRWSRCPVGCRRRSAI